MKKRLLEQRFAEYSLIDRGYRFVRKERNTSVWERDNITSITEARIEEGGRIEYKQRSKE